MGAVSDIWAARGVQGQEKMSKSDPASAIFMEDSVAEVKTKIKKAFCPPGVVSPSLAASPPILWRLHTAAHLRPMRQLQRSIMCL